MSAVRLRRPLQPRSSLQRSGCGVAAALIEHFVWSFWRLRPRPLWLVARGGCALPRLRSGSQTARIFAARLSADPCRSAGALRWVLDDAWEEMFARRLAHASVVRRKSNHPVKILECESCRKEKTSVASRTRPEPPAGAPATQRGKWHRARALGQPHPRRAPQCHCGGQRRPTVYKTFGQLRVIFCPTPDAEQKAESGADERRYFFQVIGLKN